MSPAKVTPAKVTPVKVTPAKVTPARVTLSPQQIPAAKQKTGDDVIFTIRVTKRAVVVWSVLFGLIATGLGAYSSYDTFQRETDHDLMLQYIGPEGMRLFETYDRDKDGYLSLMEYEPIAHSCNNLNISMNEVNTTIAIPEDDEMVTVQTHFKPLQVSSMSKNFEDDNTDAAHAIPGLVSWDKALFKTFNFGASHFKAFLPKDTVLQTKVGEPYDIVHLYLMRTSSHDMLSSNRYYPPPPGDENFVVHQLLTLFHPRPFIVMRFQPRGSVACVRAYNDLYIDIAFRIHAEFQLSTPPYHPFWFTPAQFQGHIVMSRDGKHIVQFEMSVPTAHKLNVDMEWMTGVSEEQNMEVDIGFMEEMRLSLTSPSRAAVTEEAGDLREVPLPDDGQLMAMELSDIQWKHEISREDTADILGRKLFKFKEVPYYDFTKALDVAQSTNKLIHLILMWGALDDQSC